MKRKKLLQSLVAIRCGLLFGGLCLAANLGTAQVFQLQVLHAFQTGGMEGDYPGAALTLATDSNFYGTTYLGGTANNGTVFRLTPTGTCSNLYSFKGLADDNTPNGLIQGLDGNLYGTTVGFPVTPSSHIPTGGTVFRITTNGNLTTLHHFEGWDGWQPEAGLTLGSDGFFYGTTAQGGDADYGTVFRVATNGAFISLASFTGDNGAYPFARLVQGLDGNFYGTTQTGGDYNWGTVFRMTTDGVLTTLYSFTGGGDGALPLYGLTLGPDGNFYGGNFGLSTPYGTLFRITTNGDFTTLYAFSGGPDNDIPVCELTLGRDGNLYGIAGALAGVDEGWGTVFRLTTSGDFSRLYSFTKAVDGSGPYALVLGNDTNLYGTTADGGPSGGGTAFRLIVPQTTCAFTSVIKEPVGSIALTAVGPASAPCRLWASPSPSLPLPSWTLLASGSFDGQGSFSYTDSGATDNSFRFYRLSLP